MSREALAGATPKWVYLAASWTVSSDGLGFIT